MIQEFVDTFMEKKGALEQKFSLHHPDGYSEIVKSCVEILSEKDKYNKPDPDRIHVIDDGDYQGTLVYVIGGGGKNPEEYWYCLIDYGSCSGCDTFDAIQEERYEDPPTSRQVKDYMTLALHVVERMKKMNPDE